MKRPQECYTSIWDYMQRHPFRFCGYSFAWSFISGITKAAVKHLLN